MNSDGSYNDESLRWFVEQFAEKHQLTGLLDLYDLCKLDDDKTYDKISTLVYEKKDDAVEVFQTLVWKLARQTASEIMKNGNAEKERRKQELLRRIEQITDTNRKMWVKTMHCIDEILPPKQEAMNFGLQVIRGTYAGWSAEELRPHLMVDSLCILAEDAEKFVH